MQHGTLYHHEALNGTGYPNGITKKDIPYEAQIIRVADEFEAITAKRQYKTHIGIIEALNFIIEDAQPSPIKSLPQGLKIMSDEVRYGKVDKKIVKALFKVVIDDIEYEISARTNYIDYLKSEIKRIKGALKYYDKMEASSLQFKKDYYREGARAFLRSNESVELSPEIYEQLNKALKERIDHIEKLYDEARQVKRLVV